MQMNKIILINAQQTNKLGTWKNLATKKHGKLDEVQIP